MKIDRRKTIFITLFVVVVILFCEYVFFRNMFGTGNLFGDRGDGRFTNLIAEHWYNFFRGKEAFGDLGIFFPHKNTLAYSDMLIGFGLLHSLFRFIGWDMFNAYKLTLLLVHAFGSFAFYYLLNQRLKVNFLWSLFGVICFSYSNAYAHQIGHTQLFAISLIPLLAIFMVSFFQCIQKRKWRNLNAYGAMSVFAILCYTAWYVAFFAALFCIFFAIIWCLLAIKNKYPVLNNIRDTFAMINIDFLGWCLFFIVVLLPFAILELPVLKMAGKKNFNFCRPFLPDPIDLLNVSDSNFVLGGVMRFLKLASRKRSGEVIIGFSLILFIPFFVGYFLYFKRTKVDNKNLLIKTCFFSVVVGMLFVIQLSSNGVSLWWFIFKLMPGATSIRAVARYALFLSFPMALVTTIICNAIADSIFCSSKIRNVLCFICLALAFLFNIDKQGAYSYWKHGDEFSFIKNVAQPPKECKIFCIIDSEKRKSPGYIYQLDAHEIATVYGLKTINGYSGLSPRDYSFWNVCEDGYEKRAIDYCKKHKIDSLYYYDCATNTWGRF